VGEALVSLLDAKGRPSETEQAYVLLPGSQLGPITPEQRQALLTNSLVAGVYEQTLDRESAYERLKGQRLLLVRLQRLAQPLEPYLPPQAKRQQSRR